MENKVKVIEYENGNVEMLLNERNPFKSRKVRLPHCNYKERVKKEFKSKKSYRKNLSNAHSKFIKFDINQECCIAFTLTTKDEKITTWDDIIVAYQNFSDLLRRDFKGCNVARAIEFSEKNYLHVHLLVEFSRLEQKLRFDAKWVKSHWKYGSVRFSEDDLNKFGFLRYMTKLKKSNYQIERKYLTKYPNGAQIIAFSSGFRISKGHESGINIQEIPEYIQKYIQEYTKRNNGREPLIFLDFHTYWDKEARERKTVYDRIYLC